MNVLIAMCLEWFQIKYFNILMINIHNYTNTLCRGELLEFRKF